MSESVDSWIPIIGLAGRASEEFRGAGEISLIKKGGVTVETFGAQLTSLVCKIGQALERLEVSVANFDLEHMEIDAAVTVSGEVSLLAFGGKAESSGSIKLVFKKRRALDTQ